MAYPQSTRQEAARLYNEGQTQRSISDTLQVPYKTIRNWIKRYRQEGASGLLPDYSACGRPAVYSQEIVDTAVAYKQAHPSWGAGFIRIKLQDDYPNTALPKERQLQNYFQKYGVQPNKDKLPKSKGIWATAPFERVQVDAKECLQTADGQSCCYLNFADEYTGSELEAFVFPLRSNK